LKWTGHRSTWLIRGQARIGILLLFKRWINFRSFYYGVALLFVCSSVASVWFCSERVLIASFILQLLFVGLYRYKHSALRKFSINELRFTAPPTPVSKVLLGPAMCQILTDRGCGGVVSCSPVSLEEQSRTAANEFTRRIQTIPVVFAIVASTLVIICVFSQPRHGSPVFRLVVYGLVAYLSMLVTIWPYLYKILLLELVEGASKSLR